MGRPRRESKFPFHALLTGVVVIGAVGFTCFVIGLTIQRSNGEEGDNLGSGLERLFWWPGLMLFLLSGAFVPVYILALKRHPMTRSLLLLWAIVAGMTVLVVFVIAIINIFTLATSFLDFKDNNCLYTHDGTIVVPEMSDTECLTNCRSGLIERYNSSGKAVCCCCSFSTIFSDDGKEKYNVGDAYCDTFKLDKRLATSLLIMYWIELVVLFCFSIFAITLTVVCPCCPSLSVWEISDLSNEATTLEVVSSSPALPEEK